MGRVELKDGLWRTRHSHARSYLNIIGAIKDMFNDTNNYDEKLRAL